jgi:predicted Zn finger-like uncharacterized protein
MNVTCPNCATVYRVDPAKVPTAGVRARCAVCSAVFPVRHEVERVAPTPVAAEAGTAPPAQPGPLAEPARPPEPAAPPVVRPPISSVPAPSTPAPPVPSRPAGPPRPATPAALTGGTSSTHPALPSAPAPSLAPAPAPPSESAREPVRAPSPATSRPVNPFLSQDPALKARRLARALISDMVVYHPAKRQEGLRDGTLKELFQDEIKKSWEEYTEQVGRDVAESSPYFREALNEILAGGKQIF